MNPIDSKYMRVTYGALVNEENIFDLSKRKIRKVFKKEDKDIVEKYLHNIVDKWVAKNYKNDAGSIKVLKKLIKRVGITLDEMEQDNMLILEERAFSLYRHIKRLEFNVKLHENEYAGAKFTNAHLFHGGKILVELLDGEVIITNKRIIFIGKEEANFNFSKLKQIRYTNYGFEFNYDHVKYILRIHDQITLNNTMKNIFSKIKGA